MLNVGAIMKAARGVGSVDEGLELLAGLGVDVEYSPIPMAAAPAAAELEQLAALAVQPGAKFYRVTGKAGSQQAVAFVVLRQNT